MSRIMDKVGLGIIGAVGVALMATLAGVIYAGPLDPPAGVPTTESTQSGLIFQPNGACPAGFPITISSPGTYKLAQDIAACSGLRGIDITASDVTLDFDGHQIGGVAGASDGIRVSLGTTGVIIKNGRVVNFPAGAGIRMISSESSITDMVVRGNLDGIVIGNGVNGGHVTLTGSDVAGNSSSGITLLNGASVIRNNAVHDNAGPGIVDQGYGEDVIDSNTINNNALEGLAVNNQARITNNQIAANARDGLRLANASSSVIGNSFSGNGSGGPTYVPIEIIAGAQRNLIDGNYIDANGKNSAVFVSGTFNTIVRNYGGGATGIVFNIAGGNTVGPTQNNAAINGAAPNPWANISY